MKKMNLTNGIQRLIIAACIMLVMTGVFMTRASVANASNKKSAQCSLQSVTLEIGGKQYTFEGDMEPFVVDANTDWKTFFGEGNFKVVDYKILADEGCTHEKGHDKIEIDVSDCELLEYAANNHTYNEITDDQWNEMDSNGVSVRMDMGDTGAGEIDVWFAKEYAISFDATSLEGAVDVTTGVAPSLPTTYIYEHSGMLLPVLEKSGYIFRGWTWKTETGSRTEPIMSLDTCEIEGGAVTITANWEEGTSEDISSYEVSYNESVSWTGEEKTPDVSVYLEDEDGEEGYSKILVGK